MKAYLVCREISSQKNHIIYYYKPADNMQQAQKAAEDGNTLGISQFRAVTEDELRTAIKRLEIFPSVEFVERF